MIMKKLLSIMLTMVILAGSVITGVVATADTEPTIGVVSTEDEGVSTNDEAVSTDDEAIEAESTTVSTTESTTETTTVSTTESTTVSTTETTVTETQPTTISTTQPTTTKPTVVKPTKVAIKGNTVLFKGKTLTLKATVTPTNATTTLKWTSSNTKIATVNQNGKLTGKSTGTVTITVKTDNGKSASIKIRVIQRVTSIKLNKTVLHFAKVGKTKKLTATVSPKDSSNKSVKWKSSNTKIATVTQNGKVKSKGKGHCVVTVTTKDGSNKSAKCTIVVGKLVSKVTLNKSKATVFINNTVKLKATVTKKKAVYKTLKWTSSNTKVATVNKNGKVTGIAKGTAIIKASALDGSNKSATCKVTVTKAVTGIKLNKNKLDIEYGGKSVTLKATVTPTDAGNKSVKWTSNKPKIVSVNDKGVVKAKGIGTAVITATTKDGSKKSAKCTVTATPNINQVLTEKQFNSKVSINKYVQMLNDYFEDCGAVINPNLVGSGQWCVDSTTNFLDGMESIYDFYVETIGCVTWRRAQDNCNGFANGNERWNNITNETQLEKFLADVDNYCGATLKTYNPKKVLDANWNGWYWFLNEEYAGRDKVHMYVYAEPTKPDDDGITHYIIYIYWEYESALPIWGIPMPDE
jgi:uncharacterized protein YjdB